MYISTRRYVIDYKIGLYIGRSYNMHVTAMALQVSGATVLNVYLERIGEMD